MEASNPVPHKAQTTEELLAVIVDELKSIGLVLARQDERIEALSRAKNRSHPLDWDCASVMVKFLVNHHAFMTTHTLHA
jgi:hypothetical protein